MLFWKTSKMTKSKQWTTAQNGLDKIQLGEAEVPSPQDGEVLVKIWTVSLNYRDTEGETPLTPVCCCAAVKKDGNCFLTTHTNM
jgi:hypothetical protein